jgi:hypothetical protein
MATANFTTKPPMLDGRSSEMGSKELEIFGSIVQKRTGRYAWTKGTKC